MRRCRPYQGLILESAATQGSGPFGTSAWATSSAALAGRLRSHLKTGKRQGKGVEPFKPRRWEVRSSAIWSAEAYRLRTTEPFSRILLPLW